MSDIRFNSWLHRSGTGGVYQDSSGRVGIGTSVGMNCLVNSGPNALTFGTGTTPAERGRIDSSGRVLLGTTTVGSATADDLTVATSGDTGITVRSGTSDEGNIFFADGTSGNSNFRGYVQYNHSTNALLFGTNASERLKIDSSGNINVGTAATIAANGNATYSGIVTATAFIPTEGQLPHRNIMINGAMNVAQRGTSDTTDAQNYTTVDRWLVVWSGLEEQPSRYQEQLSASDTGPWEKGFRNAWKFINGNQTGGADANGYINPQYAIEAQDLASSGWNPKDSNSKLTLSFWAKSSVAQTFYCYMYNGDGGGDSYAFSYTLAANTWKKIEHTIPGHADIAVDNDNGDGLRIYLPLFLGTDRTTSGYTLNQWQSWNSSSRTPDQTTTWYTTNDATWHVTGFQLEVGSVATPFEHRSFADELNRCLRYYFKITKDDTGDIGVASGWCRDSNTCHGNINFPVPMRANPSSMETTGTASDYAVAHKTSGPVCSSVPAFDSATQYSASISADVSGTPFSAGECGRIQGQTSDAFLAWSAEL